MATGDSGRGADVRLIPPAVYAVPFLLLWLLDRFAPLHLPGGTGRTVVGWVLVVAGVALSASGARTFAKHDTTVIPHHAVSTIVTSGPYRLTRNPMYVGMSTAYLGGCLAIGSWWPLFALPVIIAVIDRRVIAREEAYLGDRFGGEYDAFRDRTRRWL